MAVAAEGALGVALAVAVAVAVAVVVVVIVIAIAIAIAAVIRLAAADDERMSARRSDGGTHHVHEARAASATYGREVVAHPDAPQTPLVPSPAAPATALDPRAFKDLFRLHPAGVAVVTLVGPDGAPVGFTATSVISVSAAPAVLAFSITSISSSWPALRGARSAVVSFLAHDQADLSVRFATPGIDRFADVPLTWLPSGEPRLTDVTSWARVEIAERVPAGASFLVTADVTEVHDDATPAQADQPRLVYVDRTYHRTGEQSQVG